MYPEWILCNKESYKYLLGVFKNYSNGSSIWEQCVDFTSCDRDKGLQTLVKKNNLKRLRTEKTDVLQCLMAMEWTFQHLLYGTQAEYSDVLNACHILDFCRKNHKTVNCLCHATVLTEILLSLGFKARKISCLPIDVVPFDNHVVTIVFIESLNKWIMLDPSMCCYVTDKEGTILSLQEIRFNLINDIEVVVNTYSRFTKLKVNGRQERPFEKSAYVTYLYKNLFRFISRSMQSSMETKHNDVFYMLVPRGYLKANTIQHGFIEDAEVELRITDDESFFWDY